MRRIPERIVLLFIFSFVTKLAAAQVVRPLRMDSIPVGLKPVGIDMYPISNPDGSALAVVANTGENSVSILGVKLQQNGPQRFDQVQTVQEIPAPYGVAVCQSRDVALVTSPSDGSVSIVPLIGGRSLTRIKVGAQPYSVACFASQPNIGFGVVSNAGDSTVTAFDLASGNITATIAGVPGCRGPRGVAVARDSLGRLVAWIVGTDANVVTVVDVTNSKVLAQVPVSRPTAIRNLAPFNSSYMAVASAGLNGIRGYNVDTLQPDGAGLNIPNIPPSEDFIPTVFGNLSANGQDSVYLDSTIIPGIPGASALARASFTITPQRGNSVALVTSTTSNSVYMIQQQPDAPSDFKVSNAASFGTIQVASGILASAFASTGVTQNFSASSTPLPKTLGGVTLNLGGTLTFDAVAGKWKYASTGSVTAPLLFVGPNQVNFQIPNGIANGSAVPIQVLGPDGFSFLSTLNVVATAPGIFSVLQNGQGQAAALNQDNLQNGSQQSLLGAKPAARGSVIQIYATGGGETRPSLLPGEAAPASGNPLIVTNVQPTVTIGGVNARVLFSGMAPGYVGLWQINAEVPATVAPGSALPLVVTSGGVASNTVTIAVE